MANKPGIPASGGGNRVNPSIAKKVPVPTTHKPTYGAGDGQGGNPVPAGGGGNRVQPAVAGKVGLPTTYGGYQGTGGK